MFIFHFPGAENELLSFFTKKVHTFPIWNGMDFLKAILLIVFIFI